MAACCNRSGLLFAAGVTAFTVTFFGDLFINGSGIQSRVSKRLADQKAEKKMMLQELEHLRHEVSTLQSQVPISSKPKVAVTVITATPISSSTQDFIDAWVNIDLGEADGK